MKQPLFDFDLKRASRENYITGKAAINYPRLGSTTGGWHFLSYFDRESGVAKVSLAGIHYPETTGYFGDQGITDVTDQLVLSRLRSKSQVISASFSQCSAVVMACRLRRVADVNRAVASHVTTLRAFIQHACALRLHCSKVDYFNTSHGCLSMR